MQPTQHVESAIPGRIRFRLPALLHNPTLASALERELSSMEGVSSVRANPRTAGLLVVYASDLPASGWQSRLAALLGSARIDTHAPTPHVTSPRAQQLATLLGALRSEWHVAKRPPGAAKDSARTPTQRDSAWHSWSFHRPRARRGRRTHGRTQPAPHASAPEEAETAWHSLEPSTLLERIGVPSSAGLSETQALERLAREGPNALPPPPRRSEIAILFEQLTSTPVAMLAASAVLSAGTGGIADAAVILVVLGVNAGIGYVTESGAERTITALTQAPDAQVPVLRDGHAHDIPVEQIVRGDVLVLRAGVFVAADARVLSEQELTIDESSLTGESMPVAKTSGVLEASSVPISERTNLVFRGTLVTGGSGTALVYATGTATEIGRIQALAQGVEQRATPMQLQLARLGRQLAAGAGLACAATLGVGLLRGMPPLPLLRTAISLAVAAVPEGLPTVAITTLALGLRRMRDEKVIVRQLSAVETLGSVQVVCLDKTGTITINRMTVVAAQAGLHSFGVAHGQFSSPALASSAAHRGDIEQLLRIAVLCNEVELEQQAGVTVLQGSPTESALVQVALDAGLDVAGERARYPQVSVQRRAQARNYMSVLCGEGDEHVLAVKGRPSEVLALCAFYETEGQARPLGERERSLIEMENERFAGRALRVLGFAYLARPVSYDALPPELIWVGLIGMEDPPRPGVAEVIARLHRAGVRTVMITGDQSATAQAVGRAVGIAAAESIEIVDSTRLDRIEPSVLASLSRRADVFARVSPAHKLQIVQALEAAGYVVAMTGDGVNDALALKAADIGIAMGAAGSSAARELAHVVLEDDELSTLLFAIEQGRSIYDDIRKAVHFILATNLAEILYTFSCVAAGFGEPLTPMQLLWINLVTDVFPELALAVEPAEADVLARPPRDPRRPMFTTRDLMRVGGEGGVITLASLTAYMLTRSAGPQISSTAGFTTLTLAQLLHAVSTRSETHSVFDQGRLAENRWLVWALGGTTVLQLLATTLPGLRTLLGAAPLRPTHWGISLASAAVSFIVNELGKLLLRAPHGASIPSLPTQPH